MTQNPSLEKKSAARTAAVQCLYTNALSGKTATPEAQAASLKARLKDNREEQKLIVGAPLEPNYKLLEAILTGVAERREEIDARLDSALSADWKRERMSPVLLAILQCAIYELFFGKEVAPKIIIDEYTRLTRRFFDEAESNFVFAALNTLVCSFGKIS